MENSEMTQLKVIAFEFAIATATLSEKTEDVAERIYQWLIKDLK